MSLFRGTSYSLASLIDVLLTLSFENLTLTIGAWELVVCHVIVGLPV